LLKTDIKKFNDGEVSIKIQENIRNSDVYIIQPTCYPVNDNLMELLLTISALKRASVHYVIAVVPYYGYARQDRKSGSRVPISAADVARMMEAMGVDRVICVDLHAGQIQGFFGPCTPVDNLFAGPIAMEYFKTKSLHNPVIISPDAGGVARCKEFKEGLAENGMAGVTMAMIIKQREAAGVVGCMDLVGDVNDKDCIIVDDIIDTAGTLCAAANELKAFGARRVFAFATHGLFNGPAPDRINASALEEVAVANTVPLQVDCALKCKKIRVLSVGKLLSETIRRVHSGESLSAMFDSASAGSMAHQEVFAAHSAWITGLREQYAALGSLGPVPSGFGGLGEPQLHEHLDERFNEALDFVDEPVYRSASAHLSWQPANDELNFDSDEPVYRSLGGFGGFAVDDIDVDVEAVPGSHEAWMQSMPPLVQRQSAFSHL